MNAKSHSFCLRVLGSLVAAFFGVWAGLGSQEPYSPQRIRVESALVTVPVIVSDLKGRLLSGLRADSFRLYQDDIQVSISVFLTSEDPLKIALLLDTSVSTTTVLGKIKKAARKFLLQMRPQDLATVMTFASEIQVLCPFSSDPRELEDAIKGAEAGGSMTLMRDAIDEVIRKRLRSASGRKAIVLLTDGQDHGSRISAPDLLDVVAASGASIYSVFYSVDPRELMKELAGISSRIPKESAARKEGPYTAWNEREARAAQYLEEISELSAGRFYRSNVTKLDSAFRQISEELRSQYLIGFYPDKSKLDGRMHTLRVSVSVPETVVRSRRSYRALPKSESAAR
jgi:Ca-activated chloride channel family protein